jgi:hypothetical protein
MSHRWGHVDEISDAGASMDRRKYLSTLAAGAAFATVAAAGVAACSGPSSQETKQSADSAGQTSPGLAQVTEPQVQWGYLSILPKEVIRITDPELVKPSVGNQYIKVPFVNINGIELTEGKLVAFQLLRIGCPKTLFVVAYNIMDHQHDEAGIDDKWLLDRNERMDAILDDLGYKPTDWVEYNNVSCPKPPKDWTS